MPTDTQRYRLVTRSDFDGLACAILLKELDLIDDIKFVHPKDMQDGKIDISPRDITTNLPYVHGAHLAFDHHSSEISRIQSRPDNHIIDPAAPSATRVVYDYYGGQARFPMISEEMLTAVDKADSAQFCRDDVLNPQGWDLLSFVMDARTGLGRFHEFKISNYQLMMQLIDTCRHHSIAQVLELPHVKERTDLYFEHQQKSQQQIQRCAQVHKNLVVLDLRDEGVIYATNRFVVYALFPQCNISIHEMWGLQKQNTVFATGKSIFDRSSKTNVGALMLEFEGGGHEAAGTCQVANDRADQVLKVLIARITADG